MIKENKLDKVCTHPPVPPPEKQVAKCALCMKPLGRDAMVTREGKAFCCNSAADMYESGDQHYQEFLGREKKGAFGRFMKKVAVLIILVVLLGAIYVMFGDQIMAKVNELRGASATEPATPAE